MYDEIIFFGIFQLKVDIFSMLRLSRRWIFFMCFLLLLSVMSLYADEGFFLQGRTGVMVKIDPLTGFKPNYPEVKGPVADDIKRSFTYTEYEVVKKEVYDIYRDKVNIDDFYGKIEELYVLKDINDADMAKLRQVFLSINKKNEIFTGLTHYGMPMPHNVPRVFDPVTKANFDIHFVMGYRFENNLSLAGSINLTNFMMPSLEIMVKYNFDTGDKYAVEPFVGGVIYGGVLDGFPIGFNMISGIDYYPEYFIEDNRKTNIFVSGELRIGTVLYTAVYYDSGINSEGIWKKLSWLLEGGIYAGSGYRFDK